MTTANSMHKMNELAFEELPYFFSVYAITENGIVSIECHSQLHEDKVAKMPTQFAEDYYITHPVGARQEILEWIVKHYGLRTQTKYSL